MTNASSAPRRCRFRLRHASVLAALVGLSGCAGAHVSRGQECTATQRPSRIFVETSLPPGVATPGPDIQEAATSLQSELLKDMNKTPILAVGAPNPPAGPGSPGVILNVHIVSVDAGDLAERLSVGFGLGRSKLTVRVSLTDARQSPAITLLAFDVASDSGRGPGLIMPAGVYVGTASAVGFAIGGGSGLLLNLKNGPGQDAVHTAAAIAKELSAYFARAGWATQS